MYTNNKQTKCKKNQKTKPCTTRFSDGGHTDKFHILQPASGPGRRDEH